MWSASRRWSTSTFTTTSTSPFSISLAFTMEHRQVLILQQSNPMEWLKKLKRISQPEHFLASDDLMLFWTLKALTLTDRLKLDLCSLGSGRHMPEISFTVVGQQCFQVAWSYGAWLGRCTMTVCSLHSLHLFTSLIIFVHLCLLANHPQRAQQMKSDEEWVGADWLTCHSLSLWFSMRVSS